MRAGLRLSLALRWALLLGLLGLLGALPARAAGFDHASTGFPLLGKHEEVRCETCHVRAIFRGTPRDCASCHVPNNERGATAAPARHLQTQQACDACHSVSTFAGAMFTHVTAQPGGCTTCHDGVRAPGKSAGHLATAASCDQCHNTSSFAAAAHAPANHIPFAAGTACSACHTGGSMAVMPSLTAIHAHAPNPTGNCAQCHGATAASFAIPAAGFAVVGMPANHLPTTAPCEQCHAGPGTGAPLPVGEGARFSGALMDHAGIANGCAACHLPAGAPAAAFAGIRAIVGMPPTQPPGAASHLPTATACESCHLANLPAGRVPANATRSAPGTGFASPAPTSAQIHAGIGSGCAACHEAGQVWMGVTAYPPTPTTLLPGAAYRGFQTRPTATASAYGVADAQHPASGDCASCHVGTTAFTGTPMPANHIPFASWAGCAACHTSGNYGTRPTMAAIHANAPSTTGNCAQCHGDAAPGFAIPASGFAVVGKPANHLPTSAPCEQCHVGPGSSVASLPVGNGASFAGSLMSHAGIRTNCAACHQPAGSTTAFAGVRQIVGMPPTGPAGAGSHIPSSTVCESCHLGSLPSAPVAASATTSAPGTRFASPAPTGAQIHAGVSSGCAACHDAGAVWMGVAAYPINPQTLTAGASYTGFQTRPRAAAGPYNVADAAHPSSGDCSECHGSTTAFTGIDKPANHIPTAPAAQCTACHNPANYAQMPSLAAIHANAPNPNGDCAQCHGANAGYYAIPAAGFAIVGLPANHLPTSASCEACHVGPGSSVATLPVGNGARFSGSLMSHAGITRDCATCHVPAGTPASFAGIGAIVTMPATSPPGPLAHLPTSTTCESCHLASVPATPVPASATNRGPGTGFASPAPGAAQIHAGISSGCAACHEAGFVWMGVGAYPIAPSTLTPGAQYRGFQTRPTATAGTFTVADAQHPASGDCSQCHAGTTSFTGTPKPANHIPYAATAACSACHATSNYAQRPTLAAIHANAPSTTGDCALCHGTNAGFYALPASGFAIVGQPANHIPTAAPCEHCHVGPGSSVASLPVGNGATFAGSLMNHAGIARDCNTCHRPAGSAAAFAGIATLIGMPPTSPAGAGSHIPSSTACESCHLANLPAGLVAASATKTVPGSGFASPAPSGAQIHAGVSGGCAACHEANAVWMGVAAYPINPQTLTAGAAYTGFQTRPRAAAGPYNVADAAHPSSGDCSQCHGSTTAFTGVDKPANHIPTAASAQCTACHNPANYAQMPTLAAIHANAPSTTSNCAQCHGSNAAFYAIPSAGFAIVGQPANHIPTAAPCEQCHVGAGSSVATLPVGNGARFSGSLMSHAGINTNCVACHKPAGSAAAFAGITALIGMPATTPAGANAHIPSSTACESCHLASLPAGLIPASAARSAPGTGFGTPAPSGPQIHAGIRSGCAACHEAGQVWMGVGAYPISPAVLTPGAAYTGFQTRPRAAAGPYNVADSAHPSSGDCSQCHGSTTAFSGVDMPANHIPVAAGAQCSACHVGSNYAQMPTLAAIHANAPSTTGNCAQCHGANAASFAIPAVGFAIVGQPASHLPTTASCEVCHVGPGSSVATLPVGNGASFAGSLMSHAGISRNCSTCHAPAGTPVSFTGVTRIVGMPPTTPAGAGTAHIPSATVCESCHLASLPAAPVPASATKTAPGTGFASPAPSGTQIHAGVSSGCAACHEAGYAWMGVGAYPIAPSVLSPGAAYTGFQTRPRAAAGPFNVADAAHPSSGDCSQCHGSTTAFTGIDKPANHIPYAAAAACDACHTSSNFAVPPTLAAIHANAPSTTGNCAQCHGPNAASFAIPSAGFAIVGQPAAHLPTAAPCEQCHVGAGSSIATLPVGNGASFAGSRMNHAGISKDCNTCHKPAGSTVAFTGITAIVGMPPTAPAGAGSHIPSSTACESCHLASLPSGLIPASATRAAPGTAFATPAPGGAQIHAGVSGGCAACHEAGTVWMGVAAYPINPKTLTPGASYTGFQTRPRAAGGTYAIADPAHPSSGDCSQCHGSTTSFTATDKPANHIPYAATAQCTSCHSGVNYAIKPTLAAIHANAPSTTGNCAQCHGSNAAFYAIPSSGFAIVGLPGNHLPTSASCEVCHVGAGSSIATLPVGNGAKFSGSTMSHSGISANCVACHKPAGSTVNFAGISALVGMPPTTPMGAGAHLPTSTACESCHLASLPAGPVPASATRTAPGTAFANPAPTGPQIHAGIGAGCATCHEAGSVWMGVAAYPISPTTLTPGASYKGFQTRPRASAGPYNVADAGHPASGDCSQCHTGTTAFQGVQKPANHIPYAATATCTACHTTSNYATLPTLAAIHANAPSTTNNCAQCHGANAAYYAIPQANFSIVGLPSNHLPTTASCEVCHVGAGSSIATLPVGNGAKFSGSLMSHSGITRDCASCHVPAGTTAAFAGVTRIIGMPPTSPAGAASHIPSSTVCESCHAGSMPSAMVPASATRSVPGTGFAAPAPAGTQIHAGVTAGCAACHEAAMVWVGMGAYPISPTTLVPGALYKGFQTRPRASAGTYNVADAAHPTSGDCALCHSGTTSFSGAVMPAGHLPTPSTNCAACHTAAGDFSLAALTTSKSTLHTGVTANCRACHVAGSGAGPFAGCTTQAACATPPPLSYQPLTMPLKAGGAPTAPSSSTHVPVGSTACELCHAASNFNTFSGTNMKPGSGSSGSAMHTAVGAQTCMGCHEKSYTWFGVRIVTRPSDHGGSRAAPNDCDSSGCHRVGSSFDRALVRPLPLPVMRGAVNNAVRRVLPQEIGGDAAPPAARSRFDHRGVAPGQCQTCHNGVAARGLPSRHFATRASCDTCHRSTAWQPAQFDHKGLAAGQCQACHNGVNASGRPGAHFVTVRACDACHRTLAWQPVSYSHLSPAFRPQPDKPACTDCHVTNGEIIPRQLHGNSRFRPVPPGTRP